MKIIESWKAIRKRNKILIFVLLVILFLAICIWIILKNFFGSTINNWGQMPGMNGMENGMVTASGTTATDMVAKQLEIESLETVLYVEEVYVSSGDSVSEGDKLVKLSADSIEEARKELKQKATEAQVAYNEQKIDYETSLIEARKNTDITVIEGKYAQNSLDLELANENQNLEKLQEQVTDALALAEEYYAAVNSNYYYTYYQVEEQQKYVQEPFNYLMELFREWNIEDAVNAKGMIPASEMTWDPQNYQLYQKFDEAVTNLMHDLESAKENYEADTNKAGYSLESAQAEYELLNAQLEQAIATLEQTKVVLQAECDMEQAQAELAESSYEATTKQLAQELNKVADENEAAQNSLLNFEEMLGDGYLHATQSGQIMMINARKGGALDVAMPYLVYSDSSNVTVTVSVDQAYIAQLEVGNPASVIISNLGTYEGEIQSINPVSQSDSRSSIYYSVIVKLKGDVSDVTSNLTATVVFSDSEKGNVPDSDRGRPDMPQNMEMRDEKIEGEQEQGEERRAEKKPENRGFGDMEGMPEKPQKTE